jgi:PLP dependent protein
MIGHFAVARIRDNLQRAQEELLTASGGRALRLVCVTKYVSLDIAEALLEAGGTELGENLLPDAADRFDTLRARRRSFTSHLIGPPQSRKVKLIPGRFDWLQALGRMKIAEMLSDELEMAGKEINVLLQFNDALELRDQGFTEAEIMPACEEIVLRMPRLRLRGLMVIPPGPQDYASAQQFERGTRETFRHTRTLFDKIRLQYRGAASIDTLSMGMSQDYSWAVQEGATMVRIGSALFKGLEG